LTQANLAAANTEASLGIGVRIVFALSSLSLACKITG